MSSELRVDKIIPTSGVPTGGGGGIIQIVQGSATSRTATSSSTYQASNFLQPLVAEKSRDPEQ